MVTTSQGLRGSAGGVGGVYLDGEEGDLVKVFDEASDLQTMSIVVVEPRTSLDLHLRDRVKSEHLATPDT